MRRKTKRDVTVRAPPSRHGSRSQNTKLLKTLPKALKWCFLEQVIDPKNNVLGLNNELVFNEDVLNYSLISSFNYENNNLDICEYISSDEKFETGNYTVNIFNKNTLLSSSSLTLK